MSEGKRPGGLTALAVINFVFAGFGALGVLGLIAMATLMKGLLKEAEDAAAQSGDAAAQQEIAQVNQAFFDNPGLLWLSILLSAVGVILLIIAGVGYLKQAKFGRTTGTLYALLALANLGVTVAAGFPFNFGSMIGLIYPLLTLFLVNTTFKDDLVN